MSGSMLNFPWDDSLSRMKVILPYSPESSSVALIVVILLPGEIYKIMSRYNGIVLTYDTLMYETLLD